MKRALWLTLMAVGVSQLGCGSSTENNVAGGAATAPAASTATAPPANAMASNSAVPSSPVASTTAPPLDAMVPLSSLNLANPTRPEEVVGAFLDGMRTGNAQVIESLLSTRARKEIADKGLDIAPIGSPQARFEIGVAQLADPKDPNTMLVSSNWIEPGTNGQNVGEYEVVWALIKEATGWRICEMAVDTHLEGEEIQVVNFENLSDVAPSDPTAPPAAPSAGPQSEIPRTASLPNGPAPTAPPAGLPPLPSGSAPAGFAPPPSGAGSLPPLPPAGFGNGSAGQPSLR